MWLDKVRELKRTTNTTNKFLAEQTHRSERTMARFFAGEKEFGIDEVREIVHIMGGSMDDILAESDFKMPSPAIASMQREIDQLKAELDAAKLAYEQLKAESAMQNGTIIQLKAENDLLRLKLEHKEEIISLHNYYNKVKKE
jgi:hypothetical protein